MLNKEKLNANKTTKFDCRGGCLCPPANKQNGITLIALIITIIVMLILVGVTINVALNGNLFGKAKNAAEQTQMEVDREYLQEAIVAAYDEKTGKVDFNKVSLEEWTESNGMYTSPNRNTFTVDSEGKIDYLGTGIGNDRFAMLKAELEGKNIGEVANEEGEFNDKNITLVDTGKDGLIVIKYFDEDYSFALNWDEEDATIGEVKKIITDENDYFNMLVTYTNKAELICLTDNGNQQLANSQNNKLVIPKTIVGTDGKTYNVTEVGAGNQIADPTNLKTLEFEDGIELETIGEGTFERCTGLTTVNIPKSVKTIGESAFDGCTGLTSVTLQEGLITIGKYAFQSCTSLTEVTIPLSVNNIGIYAFDRINITIYLKGRTEEPTTTDSYSGVGFEERWKGSCSVVCLGQ